MKFLLYCNRDARELGIEDKEGNWNIKKFKEHLDTCKLCSRFRILFGNHLVEEMARLYAKKIKAERKKARNGNYTGYNRPGPPLETR